jgi:glycosyltransferase involved in cell wall biosynthesis
MRIGFDARMITHPGIGRYIKCLVPELIKKAPEDEFVLFGDPERLKGLANAPNVRVIEWKASIYSVQEQLSFPYDKEDIDLVHVPHFNIPIFCKTKMVVTIHDLIYILFPRSVRSPLARLYARVCMSAALKKASKIITVSKHTTEDLVKVFGKRYEEKIKTVYEAAGKNFKRIDDKGALEGIREKFNLSEKIILYVGSVKPHKNVSGLLEAYARLQKRGISHQLVIVGRWDRKEDHLKSIIDKNNGINYIGEVSSDDLVALYNLSDALIHLSFYEGFGLTVLEAMQCGTPAIISEATSLPEVAGDAGLAVSPLNIGQIADTVYNVLVHKEMREGMIKTGLERAKQFSWEKTARETLEIYHSNG